MVTGLFARLRFYLQELLSRWHLYRTAIRVAAAERVEDGQRPQGQRPVVFFHASTRIRYFSLNAAFSSLAAWGLRLSGVPVVHFVCRAGMSRCVLESDPDDPMRPMDCAGCVAQSRRAYAGAEVTWFDYERNPELAKAVNQLGVEELVDFEYEGMPLGQLALPSIRWRMRRHNLQNDEATLHLYREFIQSAYRVGQEFAALLARVRPAAVIEFNGMMFPEAAARWAAEQRGIPVITHETGYQPFTGFFTRGDATERLVNPPEDFELDEARSARLNDYLEARFQGRFTMAGVKFWPEMRGLDPALLEKAKGFKQVVPVFTNVIFDTSQPHANTVFAHMFDWLDAVLELIQAHPETLFVIRAHPDEKRPRKESRENVAQWVADTRAADLPNVAFIDSLEFASSYALIEKAKFSMIYNSSIGLEAALMGAAVLAAGDAWYLHFPTAFFPQSPAEYTRKAEELLAADEIVVPPEFRENARRLVYYQNFVAALPFDEFLQTHALRGYAALKSFPVESLKAAHAPGIRAIREGLLNGTEVFALSEADERRRIEESKSG